MKSVSFQQLAAGLRERKSLKLRNKLIRELREKRISPYIIKAYVEQYGNIFYDEGDERTIIQRMKSGVLNANPPA